MAANGQAYHWCATWNNYTEDDLDKMQTFMEDKVIRGIIGKEVGHTGTPHLQMYMHMKKKITMGGLKRFSEKIHWEIMRGTPLQAWEYCEKQEVYYTKGDKPRGTTAEDLVERIKSNTISEHELVELSTPHQLRRLQTLYHLSVPERSDFHGIHWICGAPGSGKSRLAHQYRDMYSVNSLNSKWFDGYHGEYAMLIDDLRASNWPLAWLLRLADRYPLRVEIKGGHTNFNAKVIIVTVCELPENVYSGENMLQLTRRIKLLTNFDTMTTIDYTQTVPVTLHRTDLIIHNGVPTALSDISAEGTQIDAACASSHGTSSELRSEESGGRDRDRGSDQDLYVPGDCDFDITALEH